MKNYNTTNKITGFSITELMIAMGLTTIVGLGIFQVLTNSNQMNKIFSDKMDEQIESKLGDKLLVRDLRNAGPSLNNIYVKDDNGNNFFDYDIDRSSAFYKKQKHKGRTLTLTKKKDTVYFLTVDVLRGKGLFADAVTFFEVGPSPTSPYSAAKLTYKGINYNNYLTALNKNGEPINNPLLIHEDNLGKLLLVDSSSMMPTEPSRPAVFIGSVIKKESLYDIKKLDSKTIPKVGDDYLWNYKMAPIQTVQNLDPKDFEAFMYNIPPLGASGASVRIKPVRLFKYQLVCAKGSECVLYREDVLHGTSKQKIPILRGFSRVMFKRDDIATSVFQVVVENGKDGADAGL